MCEQAEFVLKQAGVPEPLKVDIALVPELVERYGLRIPVLVSRADNGTEKELGWPFDEKKLHDFLSSGI